MAAAVTEWHGDIVRGVRAVRQRLKGGPAPLGLSEPLRRRIAKIEVELEHVEQLMLAATIDRPADPGASAERRTADAAANIDRYFSTIGRTPSADDRTAITTIVAAALQASDESP